MKTNDPNNLLAAYFSGEKLSSAHRHILLNHISRSPDFGAEAADHLIISRLLKYRHSATENDDFTAEVIARLGNGESAPPTDEEQKESVIPLFSRRKWITTGAAAALAMGTGFWWSRRSGGAKAIAWIRGVSSANWSGGDTLEVGDGMSAGGRVRLLSGFVAIGFQKGVEIVLEGAADLEILSHNHAVIHQGSVAVYVPPSSQGFTLDGPGGRVKDRGACFGVSARGNEMDVHALKGRVYAHPNGRAPVTIPALTALRMYDGISDLILARPQDFLTTLPPEHSDARVPYLHWSFDEMEGVTVNAQGRGFDLREAGGTFVTPGQGTPMAPAWGKGISGSALSFSGKGDYVRTGFSGLGGFAPRTIACWVKVPRDFNTHEGYALIGWGAHIAPGDTWQMSVNPAGNEGPLGRLRMGTNEGQVIGTTDLRDDTWHHVAAVLYEGRPANVATHILLYVDGKLESAAAKSVMAIDTDISDPKSYPVVFGCNTGVLENADRRSFRGMIDEVTICAGALGQAEIFALMENGFPREKKSGNF